MRLIDADKLHRDYGICMKYDEETHQFVKTGQFIAYSAEQIESAPTVTLEEIENPANYKV